ncbi:Mannose-specific lectin [Carex littledalei]|uniref:non-specific serine/threonine protein kinase n=1 Tax=Carex littledalei TaxID=544730 RepID=A0A833VR99_9POAL|nr:Mannose-specific lectin [Carex littledalei]
MAAHLFSTFLILSATFSLLTHDSLASNVLSSGEFLFEGQEINDGSCGLAMQTDCNLVLYDNGWPIWASNTAGAGEDCHLGMLYNGNLVIFTGHSTHL